MWWFQFAVMSVSGETRDVTEVGSVVPIRFRFNTSGSGPFALWKVPHAERFIQHRLPEDDLVKVKGRYTFIIAKDGSYATLEIANATFKDSGTYTCSMVFSEQGQASQQSMELAVIGGPIISMNRTITENNTTTAKCCVDTSHNVHDELTWFLNEGRFHPEFRRDTAILPEIYFSSICSEIRFKVNRRYDQQSLKCSMVTLSSFVTHVVMNVHYPAAIRYAKNYAERLTDDVISCISEGNPAPSVELQTRSPETHWKAVSSITKYRKVNGTVTYWDFEVDIFSNIQLRCFAVNDIPPPATTINLFLVAKELPKVMIYTNPNKGEEGNDVSVYCQVKAHTSATVALSSSDKYIESWEDVPIHHPVKFKRNDTITWEFQLKDVKSAQSRKYRCVAKTSEGLSYSETIDIVVHDGKVNTKSIVISLIIISSSIVLIIMRVLITWKTSRRRQDTEIFNNNLPNQRGKFNAILTRSTSNQIPIRSSPGRQSYEQNDEVSDFTSSEESETVSVDDYANVVLNVEDESSSSTPDHSPRNTGDSSHIYHTYGEESNSDCLDDFHIDDDVIYARSSDSQLHSTVFQTPYMPSSDATLPNEENSMAYI